LQVNVQGAGHGPSTTQYQPAKHKRQQAERYAYVEKRPPVHEVEQDAAQRWASPKAQTHYGAGQPKCEAALPIGESIGEDGRAGRQYHC